jgi:hypothetical protein
VSYGIELNYKKDRLLWSCDTKKGQVNSKQAYKVKVLEGMEEETKYSYSNIWE